MGRKGDKLTNHSVDAAESLTAKLDSIGGITSKKMFGGHGIFHEKKMFGIVDSKGQCFLKVNETNKSAFENKGGIQYSRMPYFSIPEEIMNDPATLIDWAEKSIAISK